MICNFEDRVEATVQGIRESKQYKDKLITMTEEELYSLAERLVKESIEASPKPINKSFINSLNRNKPKDILKNNAPIEIISGTVRYIGNTGKEERLYKVKYKNSNKEYIFNGYRISTDQVDAQESLLPELVLNNINQEEKDDILSTTEPLNHDLKTIQSMLADVDKKSTNSNFDIHHHNHLQDLLDKITPRVEELKDIEVKVTPDIVKTLNEPLAEFSKWNDKIKVRVATADIKEQAMNRFIMSNEEAYTHEIVHAYIILLRNKAVNALSQDVLDEFRRLYSKAKKNLTYKDLLPEEEGPYTDYEVKKAKEMYNYIFSKEVTPDANHRLEEFIAYGLTNRYFKKALSSVKLEYQSKEIKYDNKLTELFYKFLDKIKKYLFDMKTKHNRASSTDEELIRLALKLGKINYKHSSKAKTNLFYQADEGFNKFFNNIYEKTDKKIHSITMKLSEKLNLHKEIDKKERIGIKAIDEILDDKEKIQKLKYLEDLLTLMKSYGKTIQEGNPLAKTYALVKLIPVGIKALSIINDSDTDEYLEFRSVIDETFRKAYGKGYNLMQDIIADFSSGRKTLVQITDMTMRFKSHLDRMRDIYTKGTLREVVTGFTNLDITSNKNKKYSHALNYSILRTDFQTISTDSKDILNYIDNPDKLDNDIKEIEDKLNKIHYYNTPIGHIMIKNSKSVAKYMLTKKGLRSNSNNIARMFGTPYRIYNEDVPHNPHYNIEEVEELIDGLISLYAFKNSKPEYKEFIKELIVIDKPGVDNFLRISKGAQVAIKQDWIDNEMGHEMVKGQLKENVDANKDLISAPIDKATIKKMKDLGYKLESKLSKDKGDNTEVKYGIYSHTNIGVTRRVDGALGLQRLQVKGLTLSEVIRTENPHLVGEALSKKIREGILNAIKTSNYKEMYPVYNSDGTIIDFRYEHSLEEKEEYLDLERRGTELVSYTFGQKNTQITTDTENIKLVDVIMKDTEDTLNRVKGNKQVFLDREFIHIKATENTLTKAELKSLENKDTYLTPRTYGEELWGLIPPNTRKYIIAKNKQEDINKGIKEPKERREFYVRKDLIKQLFGYNESMIGNSKIVKKLPLSYQQKILTAERGFMDLMQIAKGMVVIKLPRTIIGNILSNAKFLWFSGMPFMKSLQYLFLSKKSLDKWKRDEKKKRNLERQIDIAEGLKKKKLIIELEELTSEMKDNPILPLIQEGLYQTIAEDINLEEDNNKIVNYIEGKLKDSIIGENKTINSIINTLFLTRKSMVGEVLLHVTQESDFHFRAATYWYMIENGDSPKKALREVTDNFVNYNKIINSKFVQWLDRISVEAFWKYFANIQRVNLKLIKKNTTRVALDTVGKKVLDIPGDTLDSSMFYNWNKRFNPFNWFNNVEHLIDSSIELPAKQLITEW